MLASAKLPFPADRLASRHPLLEKRSQTPRRQWQIDSTPGNPNGCCLRLGQCCRCSDNVAPAACSSCTPVASRPQGSTWLSALDDATRLWPQPLDDGVVAEDDLRLRGGTGFGSRNSRRWWAVSVVSQALGSLQACASTGTSGALRQQHKTSCKDCTVHARQV
jgi:hypothetical protein